MTPWGMVVCQMAQWWRRGEYGPVLDFCNSNDVPIYDKVTAGCFEGGDFMMIEPGAALIGYSGERSDAHGAVQIKRWCEAEGWEVMLAEFDPFFVHMDVMVVMLAPKLAAVCRAIISGEVLDWLKARGIEMIDVPYQQAMAMGCNVVALGGDRVPAAEGEYRFGRALPGARADGLRPGSIENRDLRRCRALYESTAAARPRLTRL